MKSRPAFNILMQGMEAGLIDPGTVITASSSGRITIVRAHTNSSYPNLRPLIFPDRRHLYLDTIYSDAALSLRPMPIIMS